MPSINDQLVDVLPHLQRYARFLAHDVDQANDLVQDCVERAITKADLFGEGTCLRAWMFTMMRNIFINGKRRKAVAERYAGAAKSDALTVAAPSQFDAVMLSRTAAAMERLTQEERELVMWLAVEQRGYHAVAKAHGQPVGTFKSRLSRARRKLRAEVLAESSPD